LCRLIIACDAGLSNSHFARQGGVSESAKGQWQMADRK